MRCSIFNNFVARGRALSIRQPYAEEILRGLKRVEYRIRRTMRTANAPRFTSGRGELSSSLLCRKFWTSSMCRRCEAAAVRTAHVSVYIFLMQQPVRVGIVGCGLIAHVHAWKYET